MRETFGASQVIRLESDYLTATRRDQFRQRPAENLIHKSGSQIVDANRHIVIRFVYNA
jgi:hypothetical protein